MIFRKGMIVGMLLLMVSSMGYSQDPVPEYALDDSVLIIGVRENEVATYNTIATKLPVPIKSTPLSVSAITGLINTQQRNVILSDALRNASGVNIQSENGVLDYYFIRGFNSLENGLVMTDGTPEPEATFYDMYNVDRVELMKGSGTFLYGGNPLSGTVNLVRKQPLFRNFASANLSFGHFSTWRTTVDAGFSDEQQRYAGRLNGLFQRSDGYRDGRENDGFAVNPTFSWRIDNNAILNLDVEYVQSNYTPDAGVPVHFDITGQRAPILADVDREMTFQQTTDASEQTLMRARLHYSRRFGDNLVLREKFYFTDLDWVSGGTLLNGAFSSSGFDVVRRSFSDLDDKQTLIGNQIEFLFNQTGDQYILNIMAGFEVNRLEDKFQLEFREGTTVSLQSPETVVDPGNGLTQFLSEVDGSSTVLAPYILNRLSIGKNIQVFGGGRFDFVNYTDTRTDGSLSPIGFFSTDTETDRSFSEFSPMAGVVITPVATTSLYANFGRGFAPPSSQVAGDAEPEESQQIEVGLKQQFLDDKVSATIAWFDLEKKNIPILDQTGMSRQIGTQTSDGLEIEVAARPGAGFTILGSYSLLNAELKEFTEFDSFAQSIADRSGNRPAFTPDNIANVWVSKQFTNGFGVGGGFRYLSDQFIAADNVFEIDGYVAADAVLFYSAEQWTVRVNGKNLNDASYETRGFGASSVIPANPLAIFGSLQFNL